MPRFLDWRPGFRYKRGDVVRVSMDNVVKFLVSLGPFEGRRRRRCGCIWSEHGKGPCS